MPTAAEQLASLSAAYDAALDYDTEASIAKARAFVAACRGLLRFTMSSGGAGSSYIQNHPEVIERQLKEALAWLQANDPRLAGDGVLHLSLEGMREARGATA